MKTITLALFCSALSVASYAQTVTGNIQKKFTVAGKEITSAHPTQVRIYDLSTKQLSSYFDTDSEGQFSIQNIKQGKYVLLVHDPLVKDKNKVYFEVSNAGETKLQPIVVDRIKKEVVLKK